MEIKGTAVKSIKEFVEKNYKHRYREWINSLSPPSQEIMKNNIYANNWYPVEQAAVEPTKAIARMFFNNDLKEAAHITGRYSAESGLKGVYKIFVMIASPQYIIQRASRIFTSYYNPSEMQVVNTEDKGVTLHITKFGKPDNVIEGRIAGWIEKALEITNCRGVNAKITKSLTKGDSVTEIIASWN